jgi:hypothetical protein
MTPARRDPARAIFVATGVGTAERQPQIPGISIAGRRCRAMLFSLFSIKRRFSKLNVAGAIRGPSCIKSTAYAVLIRKKPLSASHGFAKFYMQAWHPFLLR